MTDDKAAGRDWRLWANKTRDCVEVTPEHPWGQKRTARCLWPDCQCERANPRRPSASHSGRSE